MTESRYTQTNASAQEKIILEHYREHTRAAKATNSMPMSFLQFRREREKGMSMLDVDNPIHTTVDHELLERFMELASRVEFGMQCKIKIGRDHEIPNGRYYFQIACWRLDVITKKYGWGYGGKAYLSRRMTDSELFQIMFGLYKGYWEHEARENFTIDGVRPFGPHISTEALISVARKVDVRSAQHVEDRDVVSYEPIQIREKTDPPFDTRNEGMGSSVFDA